MSQVSFAAQRLHPDPPKDPLDPPPADPSPFEPSDDGPTRWWWGRRVVFRFAFIYFILYAGLNLLQWVPTDLLELVHEPSGQWISQKVGAFGQAVNDTVWNNVTPWVGEHILHIQHEWEPRPSGSGDTTHDWVRLFVIAVSSVLLTGIWFLLDMLWSVLDLKRLQVHILPPLLRIGCRYYLGMFMLSYGSFKVIKLQFPDPGPIYITATFADSSPMRLVWFFMGQSTAYTFFAGLGEVIGGALLLWRRTELLGALVTIGVMANVVMLNFCYDVPVKQFSAHLLLMGCILAGLHWRRLLNLLLLNRTALPAVYVPLVPGRWATITRNVVKHVLIASLVFGMAKGVLEFKAQRDKAIAETPLYGVWEVEAFVVDGVEHPPLLTDAERWRYLLISNPGSAATRQMDGSLTRMAFAVDKENGTITVGTPPAAQTASDVGAGEAVEETEEPPPPLTYQFDDEGLLEISGEINGKRHELRLRKREIEEFPMRARGYHWINENPYNRG